MPLVKCPECSRDLWDDTQTCPACGHTWKRPAATVPKRRFSRRRILLYGLIVCVIGLPVGIAMDLPYVWGLSIAGIAVAGFKLTKMRKKIRPSR